MQLLWDLCVVMTDGNDGGQAQGKHIGQRCGQAEDRLRREAQLVEAGCWIVPEVDHVTITCI